MTLLVVGGISITLVYLGYYFLKNFIPLRPKEDGFEYVYIEEDGHARELYNDEIEYLNTTYLPNDGGRPYIKRSYYEKSPDKKISGFIKRNRIPRKFEIHQIDKK